MKKLFLITLLLLSSSLAFARFEILGKYEAEQGGRLEVIFDQLSKYPICLFVQFSEDIKFDYLRTVDICFKGNDYKTIFETGGSLQIDDDDMSINANSQILPTGQRKISLEITKRLHENTESIGYKKNLELILTDGIIEKMSITSYKRRNGLLFSYGMKKAFEATENFKQSESLLSSGEVTETEILTKLGIQ